MKYVGSKGRHAKHILPIILSGREEGQTYVEPFVGGANTIQHVSGPRVAGDFHEGLANMWKAVSKGWNPPKDVSEKQYKEAKTQASLGVYDSVVTWIGFNCSYGGKWFGGYARSNKPDGTPRNHPREAYTHCAKQFPKLIGVEFHHCSYESLPIPSGSIIYCDPPYRGTLGYSTGGFDHDAFWQWCRDKVTQGNKVFVSEYAAPNDFVCVWSKDVNVFMDKSDGYKTKVERLFVHKSQV